MSPLVYKEDYNDNADYTPKMIENFLAQLETIVTTAVQKVLHDTRRGEQNSSEYAFYSAVERMVSTRAGHLMESIACTAPWTRNISKHKKKVSDIKVYLHRGVDGVRTFELKTSLTTKTGTDRRKMIEDCATQNTYWVAMFRTQCTASKTNTSDAPNEPQRKYSTPQFWKEVGADYETLLTVWHTRKTRIQAWIDVQRMALTPPMAPPPAFVTWETIGEEFSSLILAYSNKSQSPRHQQYATVLVSPTVQTGVLQQLRLKDDETEENAQKEETEENAQKEETEENAQKDETEEENEQTEKTQKDVEIITPSPSPSPTSD
jgi:hypothetical protein